MATLTKSRKLSFLNQLVVTFCLFMIAVALFLFYLQNQRVYETTMQQSRDDLMRFTRLVSDNTDLSLYSVDLILRRASERQYFNMLFGGTLKSDIRLNLELWAKEMSHIQAMVITDETGAIAIATNPHNISGFNEGRLFPDMQHVDEQRSDETQGLLISVYSDLKVETHQGYILLSRRLEKLDGSFGGVVSALVDGRSLTEYIRTIEIGKQTDVLLMLEDMQSVVGADMLLKDGALSEWMKQRQSNTNAPSAETSSQIDIAAIEVNGSQAYIAVKESGRYPLAISLIMYEDDILAGYYVNRYYYFIFLAVFIGFTLTIGFFTVIVVRQMQRVQVSEQQALLANQTKSDFLAKVSHELRTPLNAIIGFSEMLRAEYFGKLNEDQDDRMKDVHDCATHLLSLINDLLDFSKAEAGKLTLKEEDIYLGDVVQESLSMIQTEAEKKEIIIIDHTTQCRPTLNADSRKLKQIIVNLLSNAVKFSSKEGKVTLSSMITKQGDLQIMVEDTGIGMKAEHIPTAFALFEQIHPDHSQTGTGLGLALCKILVELHGGRIGIKSEQGKGTTVFFHLPKKRLTDPAFKKR